MTDEFSFGAWIRKRRRALGLTQKVLAEQVGYSRAMLRKIESDERRPSVESAAFLAAALEIPAEQHDAFLQAARHERTVDRLPAALQEESYPWQPSPRLQTNLPLPATLFIGREKQLARLAELFADPACRLLTLVGLAGIGKTRLAVQAAYDQVEHFAGGVFFASLASLRSPDVIVSTIASAIGFQFYGATEPQEQLFRYLHGKQMLLVLDNFEHLKQGANLLAEMLQAISGIKLLVTSRERLNLRGEWVVEVEALAYPRESGEHLEQVQLYEAVQLFTQAALRVNPSFRLNENTQTSVVRICCLTEGVPLGLELAAAWVRVLSCSEIAREIENSLDFLKASAPDIPERHKSLRAALDHSWNLLTPWEKAVFRRISVFRGGFSREAAYEVAGASLEALASLLDKSLLKRVGEARYDLHELVRQYAAMHLQAGVEEEAQTQERHSLYYVSLLERWAEGIRGGAQHQVLAEMEVEIENVRLAWSWIVTHERFGEISNSIRSLRNFYEVRARFQEGAELFHEAVVALDTVHGSDTHHSDERAVLLGKLLTREGYFHARLDHYNRAAELLQRSLAILRLERDNLALADILSVLGYMYSRVGEFAEARKAAEESLALNQAIANEFGIAFCRRTLASSCLALGAYEEALAFARESLEICRELGDPHGTAICLVTLCAAARQLGNHDAARRWAEEGVRISQSLNDRWCLAATLRQLGLVHQERGEHERAEALLRQSLAHARETGDRLLLASALIAMGVTVRTVAAELRAKQYFLQALQLAMEMKTIPVALHALLEIAVSVMNEGETELALALVSFGQKHPAASGRLKARWDQLHAALAAQFTLRQREAIEARASDWTLAGVADELLAQTELG